MPLRTNQRNILIDYIRSAFNDCEYGERMSPTRRARVNRVLRDRGLVFSAYICHLERYPDTIIFDLAEAYSKFSTERILRSRSLTIHKEK